MPGTAVVNKILWLPQNQDVAVVRPQSLALHWYFEIYDTVLSTVVYTSPSTPSVQRHRFLSIDDTYSIGRLYSIIIYSITPAYVTSGFFTVVRGKLDQTSLLSMDAASEELELITGLSMLNTKREVTDKDKITGLPTEETITLYTDATMLIVLATYRVKRRLNDVRQVAGEIMYQVVEPTTSTGTGTGTSTETSTGTGVTPPTPPFIEGLVDTFSISDYNFQDLPVEPV